MANFAAHTQDMGFLRKLSSSPHEHDARAIIASSLASMLTETEAVCARCLVPNIGMFPPSLAWALCRKQFSGDRIKWYIAWQGLLEKGWIVAYGDLGLNYSVYADFDKLAVICGDRINVSPQDQYDIYAVFWATALVGACTAWEINRATRVLMHFFYSNYQHFMNVLSLFPPASQQIIVPVSHHSPASIPPSELSFSTARAFGAPLLGLAVAAKYVRGSSRGPTSPSSGAGAMSPSASQMDLNELNSNLGGAAADGRDHPGDAGNRRLSFSMFRGRSPSRDSANMSGSPWVIGSSKVMNSASTMRGLHMPSVDPEETHSVYSNTTSPYSPSRGQSLLNKSLSVGSGDAVGSDGDDGINYRHVSPDKVLEIAKILFGKIHPILKLIYSSEKAKEVASLIAAKAAGTVLTTLSTDETTCTCRSHCSIFSYLMILIRYVFATA
jgi:hypothetical protein